MALFGNKHPKKDAAPAPANRSTVKVAPKRSTTVAVAPKSGAKDASVSKSMRLRNAQDRIHQMKNSAALRAGVKRAMPS